MFLNTVHHVAIIVSDYEKARKFYVETLEFEVVREVYQEHRGTYKLDLRVGDVELEIFGMNNPPKRVNNPEACGLRHLAFKVENIEEAVEWLNKRGIETEPVRLDPYTQNHMTFFKDPDGLPLEIHE